MEKYYTLKEVSKILNVKIRTLRLWIQKGKLITKKYDGSNINYVAEQEVERIQGEMR